jgi:hypothetical protein
VAGQGEGARLGRLIELHLLHPRDFAKLPKGPGGVQGIPVMVNAAAIDDAIWPTPDGRFNYRLFIMLEEK